MERLGQKEAVKNQEAWREMKRFNQGPVTNWVAITETESEIEGAKKPYPTMR